MSDRVPACIQSAERESRLLRRARRVDYECGCVYFWTRSKKGWSNYTSFGPVGCAKRHRAPRPTGDDTK